MKDDYLWDGTGEPDDEVERLEGLLGRYRSTRPAPELPVAPVVSLDEARRSRPTRSYFAFAAAAAAVFVFGVMAVWYGGGQRPVRQAEIVKPNNNVSAPPTPPPATNRGGDEKEAPAPVERTDDETAPENSAPPKRAPRKLPKEFVREPDTVAAVAPEESSPAAPETRKSRPGPIVDLVTARHVEDAELLLRSVRSAEFRESDASELAYDAARSRELLDRNKLLRRAAETRGNLPVQRLLGDLEPYLLDIANLGANPSSDDVRSIQDRIERKEIVTDLRIYASASPARGF